ncbi:MAG: hypothetical protein GX076_07125 [Clostridiales bacterium]|nr:hypothetical protein [Clostridiales bacterium]
MKETVRLYQKDVYQAECQSKVLDVFTENDQDFAYIVLDQTVFFPEGGGQPSDTGYIDDNFVDYVFEKDNVIYHQVSSLKDPKGLIGKTVTAKIDWDKRFLNMQRHCGEHILSAVFYELYGGVNRGFHMGLDYMTVDINFEKNENYKMMTDEMMVEAELEANKLVWANLPVFVRYFDSREEAEKMPMRKELALDEDIILVGIGDESYEAGCVACCGTHPRTTGEVGLIKLYKWEKYKRMARITFDAGLNALLYSQDEAKLIKTICNHFATDPLSVMSKINAHEQKFKDVKQELYELKKFFISERAEEIVKDLSQSVIVREYPMLKAEDLLSIGKLLPKDIDNLFVLISPTENTIILISSGKHDCGKIVKDNAHVWNGKGGGRADNARAMFSSRQDMDCFVDYLKKAFG